MELSEQLDQTEGEGQSVPNGGRGKRTGRAAPADSWYPSQPSKSQTPTPTGPH